MTNQHATTNAQTPGKAVVKKSKKISMVWFIPVLALVLGAWLVYRHEQDKGPLISISFDNAGGLAAGKTTVKYRDVELGVVENIRLSEDISHVIVSARMSKEVKPYLNENARFWVVKPRIGLGGVSGLGTLLSGAYIAIDSEEGDKSVDSFVGLENPPSRSSDIPGINIVLNTDDTGSLVEGSPVYYRQFHVGEIDKIELTNDFSTVRVEAFINAPYDQLVTSNSSFWNVSGISAELNSEGVSINMQSLESLLLGGIAFDSPPGTSGNSLDTESIVFNLHKNRDSINLKSYTHKEQYVLNFDQSIRGLNVGAPVSYRGLEIGQVLNIDTFLDEQENFYIPILIEVEPERLGFKPEILSDELQKQEFEEIVAAGMRAKLQTGNLLTGQLYVSLDFYPDAEPVVAEYFNNIPEIPTLSTDLGRITQNAGDLLNKINKLDIESLINNVNLAVTDLRGLIDDVDDKSVKVLNSIDRTLAESRQLINGLDEDSITRYQLNELMEEVQQAARSVRKLTETIEKNPNSLIFGRQGGSPNQ